VSNTLARTERAATTTQGAVDLVVRAPRLISASGESSAAVLVKDGVIVGIEALDAVVDAAEEIVLAEDEVLMPGVCDTHVHVNEPGRTPWEGFETATRAAAAGGTTTLIDMPLNSIPSTTTLEALRIKQAVAGPKLRMDVGFWGGAVPENIGQLKPLWDAGVFGFKCFMAPSGVDEYQHLTPEQLEAHLTEIASFDGLMIVHAENDEMLGDPDGASYAGFVASRPPESEVSSIGTVIDAARRTGARVHILHLSTASAVAQIAEAKRSGVRITAETCPHYLSFAAQEIADGATQFKCCPPIREEAEREALWQALIAGDIDYVASDHSPCTADLKRMDVGDFGLAWGGIASVQLVLTAVWSGARDRGCSLSDVVSWLCEKPSANVHLGGKGKIAVGYDADMVVFAPEATVVVDVNQLQHRNKVSPYDGRELHGLVRRTVLRGADVDLDVPRGRMLTREA